MCGGADVFWCNVAHSAFPGRGGVGWGVLMLSGYGGDV